MRIAYSNLVDATAVTLIASSADSNYPVTNVQDQRLTTVWHTTGGSVESVIVDLGSSQAVNTVALMGHSITSSAVVTLTGSDSLVSSAWADWAMVGSALAVSASVGAALAAISSTRVAYIDAQTEQLQAYSWSGSVWTTLGSALTITGIGTPALAVLTASRIAFIDSTVANLSTYAFSGSVWSLVGSALNITSGFQSVAGLTASSIAFIDSTNDQLRTYAWSGSVWSVVGSALSITTGARPALGALSASVVAYVESSAMLLGTYLWSGSVWSAVGSTLLVGTAGVSQPAIAALGSSQVAIIDASVQRLQSYGWSGSAWASLGDGLAITSGIPALAALNTTDVAFADITNDQLRTYRGNSTITAVETISYDADVMLKFFTSTSRRYWRVKMTDSAATGFTAIGRVWLGTYITVEPSSLVDFRVTKKRSDTVVYGKHRQKFADPGYGWRRFELSFPVTGSSMLSLIETMYDTVGNHTSMIFCNFDTARDWSLVEPCYCSIDGDIQFVNKGGYRATYSLALEEDR